MKNSFISSRFAEELREALLGTALAVFFAIGLVIMVVLWFVYGDQLNWSESVQASFTTVYATFVSIVLIRFGGGHALERGKKASFYFEALAKCPATARGRRR